MSKMATTALKNKIKKFKKKIIKLLKMMERKKNCAT
jgi:hypothetical protein